MATRAGEVSACESLEEFVGSPGTQVEFEGRPKRSGKPTLKVIEKRLRESFEAIETIWESCQSHLNKRRLSSDNASAESLKTENKNAKQTFEEYSSELLAIQELCAGVRDAYITAELDSMEQTAQRRSVCLANITQNASERIQELQDETRSLSEMQKRLLEMQARSESMLEEEEKALSRKRRTEPVKLESVRLDEEAELALAQVKILDKYLGDLDLAEKPAAPTLNLPNSDCKQRVQDYVNKHQAPLSVDYDNVTRALKREPRELNPLAPTYPAPWGTQHYMNPFESIP
ncbi:predicted protein [Nematostella vectensis]|uniref:Uncharacterized protein n=1 Tax=Nematostella vectensis TaxID=45351 RepID=A7RQ37_NEMVE|nr:predicted protein [Nematostella vectensis]|eukprot:XP_001638556.1 predicted protein [Nematostella vectensis]